MTTLIWRRGLRGPSPAVSPQDFVDAHDKVRVLATHKIKPEYEHMSLAELAILYPPPKERDD